MALFFIFGYFFILFLLYFFLIIQRSQQKIFGNVVVVGRQFYIRPQPQCDCNIYPDWNLFSGVWDLMGLFNASNLLAHPQLLGWRVI